MNRQNGNFSENIGKKIIAAFLVTLLFVILEFVKDYTVKVIIRKNIFINSQLNSALSIEKIRTAYELAKNSGHPKLISLLLRLPGSFDAHYFLSLFISYFLIVVIAILAYELACKLIFKTWNKH